jgi:hypothetical protein
MRSKLLVRLARLLAGVAIGLVALPGTAQAATSGWTGTSDVHWMIDANALTLISGYTGNNTLVVNAFNNNRTNVMGTPTAGLVPSALTTKTYENYAAFQSALPNLAAGTWVVYDLESWSMSDPDNTDPATYMTEFVNLAHQNSINVILAPALDLVKTMSCDNTADKGYQNYLTNCQIPTLVANAGPDAYEIQSQYFEACTAPGMTGCATTYLSFVQAAASQAQSIDTSLPALAGLSTNPGGVVSTGATLNTDAQATQNLVEGYWLNVPEQSTYCPSCVAGGAPNVAVDFLHDLGYQG